MPSDDLLERMGLLHVKGILEHCNRGPNADLRRRLSFGLDEHVSVLLNSLLKMNPLERPTAEQALLSPFFRSIFKRSELVIRTEPFRTNHKDTEFLTPAEYRSRLTPGHAQNSTRPRLSLDKHKSQVLASTRESIIKNYSLQRIVSKRSLFDRETKPRPGRPVLKKKKARV
jgi:hypothetical protein